MRSFLKSLTNVCSRIKIPILLAGYITLLLLAFTEVHAQPALVREDIPTELGDKISVLQDTTDAYTAGMAYSRRSAAKKLENAIFSQGYARHICWLLIPVENATGKDQQLVIEVADAHVDLLELYSATAGDSLQFIGSAGDLKLFDSRPVPNKNFVFPFSLEAGQSITLLLKVDNRGHTTMMPVAIHTAAAFYGASVNEYLGWGIFTGILLFVGVFSLFIFISLEDRLYLFYALYVLSVLVWIWSNTGLGYQYIWSEYPHVMARIRLIAAGAGIVLVMQVMQLFLAQTRANSRFYRATNVVKYLLCVISGVLFIPYDFQGQSKLISIFLIFSDVLILSAVFVVLASIIEKIRQKQRTAIYYLVAVATYAIGGILVLLVRLNFIEATYFTLNAVYAGILLEIIILTFGLTQRYHYFKKESEKMLLAIKDQEREEAVKIALAKEEERKRIAADMHDDLGAGISGLRLMSELSTRKSTVADLQYDAGRISALSAGLADKVKEIIWTLHTGNDSLEDLVLFIQNYGRQFFEPAGIAFRAAIPVDFPVHVLPGEVRRHLFLITKEIFNNTLKHASATEVTVTLSWPGENQFRLVVCDNGTGFLPAAASQGNGIRNMHSRIGNIGGSLYLDSSNGTCITLLIPLVPAAEIHTPKG